MKIAFDVDVLAKQMPIKDYVRKVADWGCKYIEQSPHPRINPFYKHPLFLKECEEEYRKALKETGVEISSFIVVYRWSGPTEEQRQHAAMGEGEVDFDGIFETLREMDFAGKQLRPDAPKVGGDNIICVSYFGFPEKMDRQAPEVLERMQGELLDQ